MPDKHPVSYLAAARIREALRRFDRRTEAACNAHGLTADQYTVLLMIKGAPSETETSNVGELSQRLQLAHNGVAERLRRAERAGLVARLRSRDDGRVTLVRLTDEGERRLLAAYRDLGPDLDVLLEEVEGLEPEARKPRRLGSH